MQDKKSFKSLLKGNIELILQKVHFNEFQRISFKTA